MSMLYTTEVLEMDERALMKLKTLWSDIKAAVMLGKKDNVKVNYLNRPPVVAVEKKAHLKMHKKPAVVVELIEESKEPLATVEVVTPKRRQKSVNNDLLPSYIGIESIMNETNKTAASHHEESTPMLRRINTLKSSLNQRKTHNAGIIGVGDNIFRVLESHEDVSSEDEPYVRQQSKLSRDLKIH